MKVLWFSHLVPYPATGLGVLQRSYNLLRELAHAHQVHLVAFVQRQIIEDLLGDVESGLESARRHLEEYCAAVRFLPIPSEQGRGGRPWLAARSLLGGQPYTIRWLDSGAARALASELSRTVDFDVVHFDTVSLAPYRKYFTGGPITLGHHNIESEMMLRRAQGEGAWFKRLYFWQEGLRLRRFERRVCPKFDLNITCSHLDSERLRVVAPGIRVTEVPNGVDTAYFKSDGRLEQPLSLVFAGNMSWYPNASAMLFFAESVWPALKSELPGVRMDVVGGNPPPRLRQLAASDSDFNLHGYVEDVRPYLARAAVHVCPIMDGGGTKLKILDALSMGKSIVAHPIACEGIAVRDGKDVVLARDAGEFVRSIVGLLRNPERREELSRNARILAESTYSYALIGRKLVSALEALRASRTR